MAINGINSPYSGMQAAETRLAVSANNVANANTQNFKAAEVQTGDAAYVNDIGQGARVSGTYAPPRPGALAMDGAAAPQGGGVGATSGVQEMSNTDLAVERVNQMNARNAYGANSAMFQAADQVNRTLMNLQG